MILSSNCGEEYAFYRRAPGVRADTALHLAKNNGRNHLYRKVVAQQPEFSGVTAVSRQKVRRLFSGAIPFVNAGFILTSRAGLILTILRRFKIDHPTHHGWLSLLAGPEEMTRQSFCVLSFGSCLLGYLRRARGAVIGLGSR